MRLVDRIGEPFPAGGCTEFATRVASEFHGVTVSDPLRDAGYLAAISRGEEPREVCGCLRVEPPLQVGDLVVYGLPRGRQHMGVVAEEGWLLHAGEKCGSTLVELSRVESLILSVWRPIRG